MQRRLDADIDQSTGPQSVLRHSPTVPLIADRRRTAATSLLFIRLLLIPFSLGAGTVTTPGANSVEVQNALDAASCGDTVEFTAGVVFDNPFHDGFLIDKQCEEGKELVLTTTRAHWLPNDHTRITPGHKPNMPEFRIGHIPGNNAPLFRLAAGSTGITFVGLFIRAAGDTNSAPVFRTGDDYPSEATELTDNITIDRVLGEGDYVTSTEHGNFLYSKSKRVTMKNTFVTDWHRNANETHFYVQDTGDTTGIKLMLRNYSSTFAEHYFTGGLGGPTFPTANVGNVWIEKNVMWNSWKWYAEHPDYNGAQEAGCIKNAVEFKDVRRATVIHNSAYNIWQNCGSQYPAWHVSFRANAQYFGGTAALSTGANGAHSRLTFTTAPQLDWYAGVKAGMTFCLPITAATQAAPTAPAASGKWECRNISSVVDRFNHVYDMDAPYTAPYIVATARGLYYLKVLGANGASRDIAFIGNYAQNVASVMKFSTRDDYPGLGVGGDIVAYDNMTLLDSPYMQGGLAVPPNPVESVGHQAFIHFAAFSGPITRLRIERNAMYLAPTLHRWNFPWVTSICSPDAMLTSVVWRNNMHLAGVYGPCNLNGNYAPDLTMTHNAFLQASYVYGLHYELTRCTGGRQCRDNFLTDLNNPGYVDWASGDFRLSSTSPYKGKGYDGSDLGPRPGSFPVIQNLTTAVTSQSATLTWDVPELLQEEPATLECSVSPNLQSDLGPFTVINDLNPAMFIRRDSDEYHPGASATVGQRSRTWTVGGDSTVMDDNGESRSLALEPDTLHYCRLLQGGAMKHFTFKTLQ